MNKDACPICGKNHNIVDMDKGTRYDCESNKQYYLHESIFCNTNQVETERRLNAIYNFVETKPYLRKNGMNYYWLFTMMKIIILMIMKIKLMYIF